MSKGRNRHLTLPRDFRQCGVLLSSQRTDAAYACPSTCSDRHGPDDQSYHNHGTLLTPVPHATTAKTSTLKPS